MKMDKQRTRPSGPTLARGPMTGAELPPPRLLPVGGHLRPHEPWDPPKHCEELYEKGFKGRVFEAPTDGLRREMVITSAEQFIGESLLPLLDGERRRLREAAICGTNTLAQAMRGRWVYGVWQGHRPPCLLDLKSERSARRDFITSEPVIARRLHRAIERFMRRQGIPEEFIDRYR